MNKPPFRGAGGQKKMGKTIAGGQNRMGKTIAGGQNRMRKTVEGSIKRKKLYGPMGKKSGRF